jgi:glycosyltransferase involved in cell wall biosynthesis
LRIHILFEHGFDLIPHGCSYIRLLLPFSHPSISTYFDVSQGIAFEGISADVYIIERLWKNDITLKMAEEFVDFVRRSNRKIIYTIDDNLLDLEVFRQGKMWPSFEQKNIIRFMAREANGIIVSTKQLRDRFLHLNKNIFVIGNSLDERLIRNRINRKRQNNKNKVIGYMGTHSHDMDIMMILPALREVLRKYRGNLTFELVGVLENSHILKLFEGLDVRLLDTNGNHEYPRFMKWMVENLYWDFAIAPLENTKFTCCKSDLKFLDYSALGIPGIYSKVPAYEHTINHLTNGYLAINDTDKWVIALEKMIQDEHLRESISKQAYEYVHSKRTLEHCANQWTHAVNTIVRKTAF